MQKYLAPLVVGGIVLLGGSFYGGMRYQQTKAPAVGAMRFGGGAGAGAANGQFAGRRGATGVPNGAGLLAGEVLTKDANSLTLKLRDGGSRIVFYGTSTRISKMADGMIGDVSTGTAVTVNGATNQDGSVTAEMIQLRPNLPEMGQPRMP